MQPTPESKVKSKWDILSIWGQTKQKNIKRWRTRQKLNKNRETHYKNSEGVQASEKKYVMINGIGEDSLDLSFK